MTTHLGLPPGKYRRLGRLSDEQGRFAMLAIDQRGSLQKMIGARMQMSPERVGAKHLRLVKHFVTEAIAPLATAVLTDPLNGYPSSVEVIPPSKAFCSPLKSPVTKPRMSRRDGHVSLTTGLSTMLCAPAPMLPGSLSGIIPTLRRRRTGTSRRSCSLVAPDAPLLKCLSYSKS